MFRLPRILFRYLASSSNDEERAEMIRVGPDATPYSPASVLDRYEPAGAIEAAVAFNGAQIFGSLEYVARVCRNEQGRRGKFDVARACDVLIITGRFGFKTLDVGESAIGTRGARHVPARRDPRPERLLAGRGHGHRHAPEPDHRARSTRVTTTLTRRAASRHRHEGTKTRNIRGAAPVSTSSPTPTRRISCRSRLLRPCPRATRVSCIDQVQLRVDGRPGSAERPADLGPFARRGGDGRPIWVTSAEPDSSDRLSGSDRPLAQRRFDGLLARRGRRRAIAWTTGLGDCSVRDAAGGAIRGRTRCGSQAVDPILVAGGGIEGGPDGVAQPQTDFGADAARPSTGETRLRRPGRERRRDDRGGLHRTVQRERPNRRGRHHGLARRGARPRTRLRRPAGERAERGTTRRRSAPTTSPSGSCSAHYFEVSGRGGARDRTGAPPDRGVRRAQPAAGGLLLRHRRRRRRIRARSWDVAGAAISSTCST